MHGQDVFELLGLGCTCRRRRPRTRLSLASYYDREVMKEYLRESEEVIVNTENAGAATS